MHYLARSKCCCEAGLRFTTAGRKYKFQGSLGNGAVGLVRKAEDVETGRIVAVKLLAPDLKYIDVGAFDDVEQRFKREGLRGAHLRDENLMGKMIALGVRAPYEEMDLFELILDMFLTSPKGRPASATVAGRLATALERLSN
jgi:serine/threonine protein kinase